MKLKEKLFPTTHTIILTNGTKFKCRSSLEAFTSVGEESKEVLILDTKINHQRKIVTIDKKHVLYTSEPFANEIWNEILYMIYGDKEIETKSFNESIYG